MAIQVHATDSAVQTTSAAVSPTSFTFDAGAAAPNTVMYAFVTTERGTDQDVTSVTWDGVAMTEQAAEEGGTTVTHIRGWLYRLPSPATGVKSLTVTHTEDNADLTAGIIVLSDAHQTDFSGAQEIDDLFPSVFDYSDDIVTTTANSMVLQFVGFERSKADPVTGDANTVIDESFRTIAVAGNDGIAGVISHRAAPTIGTYTLGGTKAAITFRRVVIITLEVLEEIGSGGGAVIPIIIQQQS